MTSRREACYTDQRILGRFLLLWAHPQATYDKTCLHPQRTLEMTWSAHRVSISFLARSASSGQSSCPKFRRGSRHTRPGRARLHTPTTPPRPGRHHKSNRLSPCQFGLSRRRHTLYRWSTDRLIGWCRYWNRDTCVLPLHSEGCCLRILLALVGSPKLNVFDLHLTNPACKALLHPVYSCLRAVKRRMRVSSFIPEKSVLRIIQLLHCLSAAIRKRLVEDQLLVQVCCGLRCFCGHVGRPCGLRHLEALHRRSSSHTRRSDGHGHEYGVLLIPRSGVAGC